MRLKLPNWLAPVRRKALPGARVDARPGTAMGPWTQTLNAWVAREVAPRLYEALREAIPPIDAAIARLCTLDGILRVQGGNDALVAEIEDWMDSVPVNDLQEGLQSFYAGQSNELYEQGFGVGTFEVSGRDVVRLRVRDSKGVYFAPAARGIETWYAPPAPERGRHDGTDQVERVLRNNYRSASAITATLAGNGYQRLRGDRMVHAALAVEADNPYGVSLLRSMEFVARVLLTMDNAQLQTWRRFGDPIFEVTYKTKSRVNPEDLDARKATLAANLAKVLAIKAGGNSADFVNAVGRDDELAVKVLGGDGAVMEIEHPARHVLEQIVAKTGLPSWMLGFHWSTAERLAQRQGEIVLQESRTRFATRKPGLTRLVATMLRARGRTWERGDWELVQELPSLQDLVAQAQAKFLEAQTELMLSNAGAGQDSVPDRVDSIRVNRLGEVKIPDGLRALTKELWAEDDPALPRIEQLAADDLVELWQALYPQVLEILGLPAPGKAAKDAKAEEPLFVFDGGVAYFALLELEARFVAAAAAQDGPLVEGMLAAWLRGVVNSAAEIGADRLSLPAREAQRAALTAQGMQRVRVAAVRALRADMIADLAQGAYDGRNMRDVARALKARFDVHDYDWVRLARSEIVQAQAQGKMDQYAAHGVEQYDYVTARDGKVSEVCRGLAAAGPYAVGQGPLPMRDSHPNCRCTVAARA